MGRTYESGFDKTVQRVQQPLSPSTALFAVRPGPPGSPGNAHSARSIVGDSGPSKMRTSEVEHMVATLDQRVTQRTQSEAAQLRMFEDQAQRLSEGLSAMRVAREIQDERKLKELRMIESSCALDLHSSRKVQRDLEEKLELAVAQRGNELREELLRNRSAHEGSRTDYAHEIGEEVKRLGSVLEEHRDSRMSSGERVVAALEGDFQKVRDAVAMEQRLRSEAESTMLHMVEDVSSRMRGEIASERQEREAAQGRLLGLLEDACQRLEIGFHLPNPLLGNLSGRAAAVGKVAERRIAGLA